MIDTPGMRELQLWDASESVRGTFEDVKHWLASVTLRTAIIVGNRDAQ